MMDEIKSLKLAAYEQRLESERAELQFLQIQIRPHFYLNCLKNLFSMLEAKRYENMRTLILTLSGLFEKYASDHERGDPFGCGAP